MTITPAIEADLLGRIPTGLFIRGEFREASDGGTFDVHDPSTGQALLSIADATPTDGAAALAAADEAQRGWSRTPPRARAEILRTAFELLTARADDFALLMTLEMGKPLAEARGEVAYGAEFLRWFSEETARISGRFATAPDGNSRLLVTRRAVGPCLFITPWNFPLAMATRKIAPAIAAGCTMVLKPAALTPLTALFFAQLLQEADVKFTILGPKERCTGDPARRTGDEFLFQQLAEANIGTLDGIGTKQVVTSCPHCFHTLKNEYPQLGGNYAVQHHTQYLAELVESGRLKLPADYADTVTYHDPCFLARVNGETQAPRKLLNGALTIPLVELERRESKTFCCGAGGGRMWMEESPNTRPGVNRAQEIMATGAKTVAVGCPFCKIMVGDSIAQVAGDAAPPVMDVAEVMLAAIQHSSTAQNNSAEPQESAQQQRAQPQNPEHRGGINL